MNEPVIEYHKRPDFADAVEEEYDAKWIGWFSIKTMSGGWSESPVAIFYANNPDVTKGHSHYLGLFNQNEQWYITRGDSAFEEGIEAVVANNGNLIFSGWVHDYRTSQDGSVSIDGGRFYTKTSFQGNPPMIVKLVIDKDKLVVAPEDDNE